MSYYQIEDVVEDSIYVVHKASLSKNEKRALIYNLYNFHDKFDTSYTRFRVLPILLENSYLYAFPLTKHPDYLNHKEYFNQFDKSTEEWIPVNVNNEEAGNVYLKDKQLWFEANDNFWLRVRSQLSKEEQNPPQEMTIPALFLELLTLSFQQGDPLFTKRWYATFVNSILGYNLDESEGIPERFETWLKQKGLLKIRKFIEENQDILSLKDKTHKNDELLALPQLREELELATKPDERAILRFLLDPQTAVAAIEKDYRKEIDYQPDFSKYHLIYEFFREKLDEQWQDGIKEIGEEKGIITFLKKYEGENTGTETLYNCIILDYTTEIKTIDLKVGIQNARILNWQNRAASSKPELQHFTESLLAYADYKEVELDKNISNWGVWKYDVKRKIKTLTQRLNSIWYYYTKHHVALNKFYCSSLSQWMEISAKDELMNKRENLLEKGISFFGNEMDFTLFIACLNHKNEHDKISKKYIKEVENLLKQGKGSPQLKERIKQGLNYLDKGEGSYPEISTLYSRRLYKM